MKNEQALPGERFDGDGNYNPKGITKREYFAAMAMQGLQANIKANNWTHSEIASYSFYCADAMLKESEKND